MGTNKSLYRAQQNKNTDYFTLYTDIQKEISNYKSQLYNKRILCPCDWDEYFNPELNYFKTISVPSSNLLSLGGVIRTIDIEKSKNKLDYVKCNFIKFFLKYATEYKIKSLSVSGYNPETTEGVKFQDIDYSNFDIIITNPPFNSIKDLIPLLFKYNKQFLIVGPLTAITYKEVFNYIQSNQLWLGYSKQLSGFQLSDGTKILSKTSKGSSARSCKWYTNIEVSYRKKELFLIKKYNPELYPNYYNYNGIDVSETKNIPKDYPGVMGVPISFLTKYNPDQFEIIGKGVQVEKTKRFKGDKSTLWIEKDGEPYRAPFERILIKRK